MRKTVVALCLLFAAESAQAVPHAWLRKPQRTTPETTYAFSGGAAALMPEDRGAVVEHLTWPSGSLVSSRGTAYTMLGTVPQGTSAQAGLSYAGPFSAANRYRTTNQADPWDVTGSALIVFTYTYDVAAVNRPVAGTGPANTGYTTQTNSLGAVGFTPYSGGGGTFDAGINKRPALGSVTTSCMGEAATGTGYVSTNGSQQRKLYASMPALVPATSGYTYIGTDYDGTSTPFQGKLFDVLAISPVASVPEADALCTYYQQRAAGVVGFQYLGQSDLTYTLSGTRYTAGMHRPRITSTGILVEPSSINYFLTPLTPATQTMTTRGVTEPITCWLEGSGSIALTAGTFNGSGLPCTVSASSPCYLSSTGGGTITATVSGTVTAANCTTSAVKLELVTTGGTYPSNITVGPVVRVPNTAVGGSAGVLSFDVYPKFAAAASGSDRPVVNDLSLGAPMGTAAGFSIDYIAASAVFRLTVGGVTVNSAAQTFAAGDKVTIAVSYGKAGSCLTVGGAQTCGAAPAAFSAGAWLNLGSLVAPLDLPISYSAMSWFPEKAWAGTYQNFTQGPTKGAGSIRRPVATVGDSLTYGKTSSVSSPYPFALQGLLGSSYTVDNHGVGGQPLNVDSGNGSVHSRYWRDVEPYGYETVIVLAGTNDINTNQTSAATTPYLQSIYDRVRAQGKRLVPVTIPPSSTFTAGQKAVRNEINTWIMGYCTTNGVTCVDFATAVDDGAGALSTTACGGTCESTDHLHLSQAGYNLLAQMVAAVIPH